MANVTVVTDVSFGDIIVHVRSDGGVHIKKSNPTSDVLLTAEEAERIWPLLASSKSIIG